MSTLDGKIALISGASSGIGREAARALAGRGCRLLLGGRRQTLLEDLAVEIRREYPHTTAIPLALDVTRMESVESAVQSGLATLGGLDIVVNNAGVGVMDWLDVLDPQAGIAQLIAVNLTGAIYLTRAALPHMIRARRGHIIFVASLAALVSTPTYSVYAASKAGMLAFADALRREVRVWGIQVSTLLPGAVRTGFAADSVARRRSRVTTPGRWVLSAQQAGDAVARLAERPRRVWIVPGRMRPLIWAARVFPRLVDWAVEVGFVRRERPESKAPR
jgi:short-subunit dehydrogenase